MSTYDFKTLDDKEFEAFCADLLGEIEGTRFERFKAGRDGGVDARCFKESNSETVLQCKHRLLTPLTTLIKLLHDKEKPKVDRLKPARYILCLSHPLSRNDKRKISEAMHPHIRSDKDILGAEDLNDELDSHPAVVQRHYKLWLSSARVLSLLFEKPIFERSAFTLEEARDAAKRYVPTTSYTAALNIIDAQQVLIVSGEPGAGKTSLAEHIALRHVADGYEFFKIAQDISEAERVFSEAARQLFYFDDFLGRNYLQALSGHEGNHIANFIRRVRRDPSKRFIVTSRTTILNQGKILIDTFEHHNLKRNEYELNVSSYSEFEKAKILYSHLWHSDLPEGHIDEIYVSKRYRTIIGHKNFNPRLISFITDKERLADRPASTYWNYILETLNNPANVWESPYNAQLDDFGRLMVLLVALNGRAISETTLSEAYSRFTALPQSYSMSGRREFVMTLRHLTGSLVTRHLSRETGAAFLTLFNPSIADYVFQRFARDVATLRAAFVSLRSISSLQVLLDLSKHNLIESAVCRSVLYAVLEVAHSAAFVGYSSAYTAFALDAYISRTPTTEHGSVVMSEALRFVLEEQMPQSFLHLAKVVEWGVETARITAARALQVVDEALKIGAGDDELRQLGSLLFAVPEGTSGRDELEARLTESVVEMIKDNVEELINEADIFGTRHPFDDEAVREKVEELACALVEEYGVSSDGLDVTDIVNAYDVRRHRESFFEEDRYSPTRQSAPQTVHFQVTKDDIDELYDRA
jgi:adenylate kinase family enzyme